MGRNWEMGGNYPPGLTQDELDRHLDPMHKCKRCTREFTSDEVDPDTGICDECSEELLEESAKENGDGEG